jgi:hypothetical protein
VSTTGGSVPLLRLAYVEELQRTVVLYAASISDRFFVELGYFAALDTLQTLSLHVEPGSSTPIIDVLPVDGSRARILDTIVNEADGAQQQHLTLLDEKEIPWLNAMHASALALLEEYSADVRSLVSRLVGCCLVSRSPDYRSASFPFALGAIWLSPGATWTMIDYAESLLHETTHQMFYLDDMVNGLFSAPPEVLDEPTYQVMSAVRKVPRRYDHAFHAATVAAVLGHFHGAIGDEVGAVRYWSPLASAVRELGARADVLTDRGKAILREMADCAELARSR